MESSTSAQVRLTLAASRHLAASQHLVLKCTASMRACVHVAKVHVAKAFGYEGWHRGDNRGCTLGVVHER